MGTPEPSPKLKEVVMQQGSDHSERAQSTDFTHSVEQDRLTGNKTQSEATLDRFASFEVDLSGGPRCQETMGEVDAHARHETSSKQPSKDPKGVSTSQPKGEDRYHYSNLELLEYCTKYTQKVMELEKEVEEQKKVNQKQQEEIDCLKRLVWRMGQEYKKKKFQKKARAEKLKRMKRIGTAQRVSSSSSESDATKKGEKKGDVEMVEVNRVIEEVVMDINKEDGAIETEIAPVSTVPVSTAEVSTDTPVTTEMIEEEKGR